MNVVVVGSLNMDVVIPVNPYPGPGETVVGGDIQYIPGGKGANQALAAARLGAEVTMLGMVGNDAHGEQLIQTLKRDKVHTEYLEIDNAESSGIAFVHLETDGSNRIIVSPGANQLYLADKVARYKSLIEAADAVLLQLEIPYETVNAVLQIAADSGVPVFLDPAPASVDLFKRLAPIDWIAPNEHEAELLTGIHVCDAKTARIAAAKLQQMGAKRVILKVGSQGAYVATENGIVYQPGFPIQPVDTTAAGDAFIAAFAVDYLQYHDVFSALRVACSAGALTSMQEGAQPSLPYRNDVLDFLSGMEVRPKRAQGGGAS